MYKGVPFRMTPIQWIEEDLQEIAQCDPDARTGSTIPSFLILTA